LAVVGISRRDGVVGCDDDLSFLFDCYGEMTKIVHVVVVLASSMDGPGRQSKKGYLFSRWTGLVCLLTRSDRRHDDDFLSALSNGAKYIHRQFSGRPRRTCADLRQERDASVARGKTVHR
jgi:hypothetical protein